MTTEDRPTIEYAHPGIHDYTPDDFANEQEFDAWRENVISQLEADSAMLIALYEADQQAFIDLSMKVAEHPEDYGGACLCKMCQSYGD